MSLGLIDSSRSNIADVYLSFDRESAGMVSWTLSADRDAKNLVDGIDTRLSTASPVSSDDATTPMGGARAIAIDHVVVNTDDLARTSAAITESLGCELRRVREAGNGVTQGFHVLDNTVIEVVSGPHVATSGAHLWGFVVVVDDLDAVCANMGDVLSPAKSAVQQGRRIATFRREAGLGVPVALMSPR